MTKKAEFQSILVVLGAYFFSFSNLNESSTFYGHCEL